MVVTRAKVDVAAELIAVVTDHHGKFAVGLQADQTVNNVATGLFKFAGPVDICLFVEASLDLHDRQHLFAGLCCRNECIDDGRVAAGSVESLLDS